MMRHHRILATLTAVLLVSSLSAAQNAVDTDYNMTKFGQAGMKFLEIGLSPRAEGLGGAATSIELGAASIFYNPAGMASPSGERGDVFIAHTQWVADIAINAVAATYQLPFAVVGLSAMSVDYGSVTGTRMTNTGVVEFPGDIDLATTAIGIGVARRITDKFQAGLTARVVSEDLGATSGSKETIVVFDAGTLYRTGIAGTVLSMSIRNYSQQAKHQDESYDLPLIFQIGVSMDAMDVIAPSEDQKLMVNLDATHPRDRAEEALFGLEYSFMDMLYLRAASRVGRDYTGAEANTPVAVSLAAAGAGIKYEVSSLVLGFDYSWTNQGDLLGSVQRFGVSFGF
jgi:hypothetical protein